MQKTATVAAIPTTATRLKRSAFDDGRKLGEGSGNNDDEEEGEEELVPRLLGRFFVALEAAMRFGGRSEKIKKGNFATRSEVMQYFPSF